MSKFIFLQRIFCNSYISRVLIIFIFVTSSGGGVVIVGFVLVIIIDQLFQSCVL